MNFINKYKRVILIGAWSLLGVVVGAVLDNRLEREFGDISDETLLDEFQADEVEGDEEMADGDV